MKKLYLFILLVLFTYSTFALSGTLFRSENQKAINALNNFISWITSDHVFINCSQNESSIISATKNRISILEEEGQLSYKYDNVDSTVRQRYSASTPESAIQGAINRELDKLDIELDAIVARETQAGIDLENIVIAYDKCQNEQQKVYDQYFNTATSLVNSKKFSDAISYYQQARDLTYPTSIHYSVAIDKINSIRSIQEQQNKQTTPTQPTTPSTTVLTPSTNNSIAQNDADILADNWIINKQSNQSAYNLKSNVLRQEVIWMAMKLGKFDLPNDYICQGVFSDVSGTKPNNWACRAIEVGVSNGIVSSLNKTFRPESFITRAEALAILMKSAGIVVADSNGVTQFSDVKESWQINVVNTALNNGFIDLTTSFYPNKNATRGEIFNMAKRILESL